MARLGDVLRRGTPMHVSAGIAITHAVQLPDQGHERMAGARQASADVVQIEQRKLGFARNLFGGTWWDDSQFCLGLG